MRMGETCARHAKLGVSAIIHSYSVSFSSIVLQNDQSFFYESSSYHLPHTAAMLILFTATARTTA